MIAFNEADSALALLSLQYTTIPPRPNGQGAEVKSRRQDTRDKKVNALAAVQEKVKSGRGALPEKLRRFADGRQEYL